MITATPLQSSMLKSTSYDPETKTLVITFNPSKKQVEQGLPGDTFYYFNVPFHVFEGILASESAGKYFLSEIKGLYEGRKVSADDQFKQTEVIPVEYSAPTQYPYPTQLPDLNSKRPWE